MVVRHSTRVSLPSSPTTTLNLKSPLLHHQTRNANFIPRPRRPYTFTQLVVLSDGSTYQHRTTSPISVYKSSKDTRNSPLWNPTSEKLSNMEVDEAGRLAAFRERFGRGWDAKSGNSEEVARESEELSAYDTGEEDQGGLLDLISGFEAGERKEAVKAEGQAAKGKGTGTKGEAEASAKAGREKKR